MGIVKKLPDSELQRPGVYIVTSAKEEYVITSDATSSRFTLWRIAGDGYEKLSTNADYFALRAKIKM